VGPSPEGHDSVALRTFRAASKGRIRRSSRGRVPGKYVERARNVF
jgi:hypothetical protein